MFRFGKAPKDPLADAKTAERWFASFPASDPLAVAIRKRYLSMRKTTIYAGSNEIQRNIIAKATLGL